MSYQHWQQPDHIDTQFTFTAICLILSIAQFQFLHKRIEKNVLSEFICLKTVS